MIQPIQQQVKELTGEVGRLRTIYLAQMVVMAVSLVLVYSTVRVEAQESGTVLRARGLIIEDSQGRPRLVLGAPFPRVPGRKRQDPPTQAMVFLDEQGFDRLTFGGSSRSAGRW